MVSTKSKSNQLAGRVVAFVIVFSILASLAVVRSGSLFGHDASRLSFVSRPGSAPAESAAPAVTCEGAQEVISSEEPGKGITGYAGPVPVKIYVSGGRIDSVVALPNSESPRFFRRLQTGGLTHAWDGKTLAEAATMEVDAVSGATYSSNAYIANVRAAAAYAAGKQAAASQPVSVAAIAALVVLLAGAVVPLFVKKPAYRLVQQLLNVAVLGFWAGTFIDYAMMLNFFSEAPRLTLGFIVVCLLLVLGLIYPLFNKPNYYCAWICPFGSLQELAGKVCKKKVKMSPRLVKVLDNLRQLLWVVLLVLLYAGWAASWIDYEIFTAFIVESASWIVLSVGGLFVLLSLFVSRPFCRFVCPTGSLLKQA